MKRTRTRYDEQVPNEAIAEANSLPGESVSLMTGV
jgi:hypothetical protein